MSHPIKFRAWNRSTNKMIVPHSIENPVPTPMGEYTGSDYMQYTGLKDKNGVEIYEGDVVNIIDPHVETWGKVVYWDYYASFGVMGSGTFESILAYGNGREMEVIGNIWENQELLHAQQGR